MIFENIKQQFLKYWFYISAATLAIFYILFDRRGRELEQAHIDAQTALLGQKLADIKAKSVRSDDDFKQAVSDYANLRANHGDLLKKLGITTGDISERDN